MSCVYSSNAALLVRRVFCLRCDSISICVYTCVFRILSWQGRIYCDILCNVSLRMHFAKACFRAEWPHFLKRQRIVRTTCTKTDNGCIRMYMPCAHSCRCTCHVSYIHTYVINPPTPTNQCVCEMCQKTKIIVKSKL